eukprot:TRINITY_DN10556_c0_g3_i1.p7 TRINITY_DN10556_c0_g3~~TRINITY_DN10556_c0_g3_i1.p7  ORF type:complete len:122 (-),score=3.30 TRINITY_DN10556_c0_g3_i1:1633-1998(-)
MFVCASIGVGGELIFIAYIYQQQFFTTFYSLYFFNRILSIFLALQVVFHFQFRIKNKSKMKKKITTNVQQQQFYVFIQEFDVTTCGKIKLYRKLKKNKKNCKNNNKKIVNMFDARKCSYRP